MRLFHISDLHFQGEAPPLRWLTLGWRRALARGSYVVGGRRRLFLRVTETVERLLAEAERLGADHLIVSGDLTTLALPEEFEAARAALAGWHGRMTILPGNHDRYTPDAGRRRLFEQAFGPELRSALPELCREGEYPLVKLVGEELALVGLCSARVPPAPGIAAGWVGKEQRRALGEILRHPRLEGRAKLVVLHHGPYRADGRPDHLRHGLRDAREVMEVAARAGAIALCHGHIHHRYRVPGPGNLSIFCAGSSTQQGREGYWLYDIDRTSLRSAEAVALSGG
ncbi:MAG: metallophosphoesterase family protein [Myxococcales bacterium]